MKLNFLVIMEWDGVITAIDSALLISFNIGAELIFFLLLFFFPFLIILWFYKKITKVFYYYNYFILQQLSYV